MSTGELGGAGSGLPAGTLVDTRATVVGNDWALCDGTMVSIIDYPDMLNLKAYSGPQYQQVATFSEYVNLMAQGAGIMVAITNPSSSSTKVLTSVNGIDWTEQATPINHAMYGLRFLNDQFVAVGYGQRVYTSDDGITWTSRWLATTAFSVHDVAWDGTQYVFACSNGMIYTSSDLVTYTQRLSVGGGDFYCCAYSGSEFVALGATGREYRSTDGTSWLEVITGTAYHLKNVVWLDGQFIATASGKMFTSSDGLVWTEVISPVGVNFGNGVVKLGNVTISGKCYTTDWVTWKTFAYSANPDQDMVVFGDVAFGAGQYYMYAIDLFDPTDAVFLPIIADKAIKLR